MGWYVFQNSHKFRIVNNVELLYLSNDNGQKSKMAITPSFMLKNIKPNTVESLIESGLYLEFAIWDQDSIQVRTLFKSGFN